jgi:hypothetical protein
MAGFCLSAKPLSNSVRLLGGDSQRVLRLVGELLAVSC